MAKWDFKIVGASFVKELVPIADDVQPRSQSFMQPSFHLEGGKIVMKESGQYVTAIYFPQIGEIAGVAPADLEDAYDKLIDLVENFNGGGATSPNLGEVLTQGNRAPLAVNANRVFTLEDRTKNLYSLFDLSTTVSLTLNNSVAYDLGDVLKIQHYVGVDGSEISTMNLVFDFVVVFYGNDLITSFSIPYGAVAYLEKILPSVWTLSYKLAQDIGGSVTPSTLISTDADNALVLGTDSKLFVPIVGGGVESVTGADVDNTDPLNPVVNPTPIDASGGGTTINDGVIEHNDLVALGSISANGRTKLSQNLIDTEAGLYDVSDRRIATYSQDEDAYHYASGNLIFNVLTGELLLLGESLKNQNQNDARYTQKGVENTTTIALDSATLGSTYPAATTGFRVYCVDIIVGAMVYEKTPSGWIGMACIIP